MFVVLATISCAFMGIKSTNASGSLHDNSVYNGLPTLGVWVRNKNSSEYFDVTDVLRLFGSINRSSANGSDLISGLQGPDGGSYSLNEKRSYLGPLDLLPTGDTGDVACQGSLNTESVVMVGDLDALALAKKWLLTVPIDADNRVWDSSGQQYHQQSQASWEAAAELIIMARLYLAHSGNLEVFHNAPDRLLCYETADGQVMNAASDHVGGNALCKYRVGDIASGTNLPLNLSTLIGEIYDEELSRLPFVTRDSPRLQVAGAKRLVQRFNVTVEALALHVPILPSKSGPTHAVTICLRNTESGVVHFNTTYNFSNNDQTESSSGWIRIPLTAKIPLGMYDLAITTAYAGDKDDQSPTWLTRSQVAGGGSRLETWGYDHADTGAVGSGASSDNNSCCAQSLADTSKQNTLSASLERAMLWQLKLATTSNADNTSYGILVVPDAFYNGVPEINLGTCSASSMWDQIRMGYKVFYINMLFLQSIDAWKELEEAGAVRPIQQAGILFNSTSIRNQVANDIVSQFSYPMDSAHSKNVDRSSNFEMGFYSWIACREMNESSGLSTCNRDSANDAAQQQIDAQMLPDQALAVFLGVGDESATRARLDSMIIDSRSRNLTRGGIIANNLVPFENISPLIVTSADKWNPITTDGFCDPSKNGNMTYSGHCVCRNNSAVGGSVCWGNFGINQQNGGRVFSTQSMLFKSGPYPTALLDFLNLTNALRNIALQLHAKDISKPLLSGNRPFLRARIETEPLRNMCLNMHHWTPTTKLDKDGWNEDECDYFKDITFGLRTGPKTALLGFAIGHLGLHRLANGTLLLHKIPVDPLPKPGSHVRLQIPLSNATKSRWSESLAGVRLGGISINKETSASVECNVTRSLDLDCMVLVSYR